MWSFALFCFVLASGVVGLGRDVAFLLALGVSLAVQGVVWLGLAARASCGGSRGSLQGGCPSRGAPRSWTLPSTPERCGGSPAGHPPECPSDASRSRGSRPAG